MRYVSLMVAVLTLGLSANVRADVFEDTNTQAAAPAAQEPVVSKELSPIDKVDKFEIGKTSYDEALSKLGKPDQEAEGNGLKTIVYEKKREVVKASAALKYTVALLPLPIKVADKTNKGYAIYLVFDKTNLLSFKNVSER